MTALRDMSITTRLAILVGAFALAFGTFAYEAFDTLARVKVSGPEYAKIVQGKDLVADVLPPPAYIIEAYLVVLQMQGEQDKTTLAQLAQRGKALRDDFEARNQVWARDLSDGPIKQALVVRSARPAREFFEIRDRDFVPAALAGNQARAAEIARGGLKQLYEEHRAAIDEVVTRTNKQNEEQERAVAAVLERSASVMKGLTVGMVVLLAVFAAMARDLGRSLTVRIGTVAGAAERIAGGDLTVKLDAAGADELGQMVEAVRRMTERLASLVGRVKQSSIDLLSTATQIAAASKEQDATMTGLGASTTEVAAAARQISATSHELLGTMTQVGELASGASSQAEEGRVALEEMDQTMRSLSDATGSISAKLATIRERAGDINGVVTTITKVADQTNLLSVNAAIEAEKAGEYGRGFLVLAREIRRLADQTAVSTLDIERIVRTMQAAVTAGVMEMDRFSDEMRRSRERVGHVARQIALVIEHVQGVMTKFEQVTEGMKNQSEGARQISTSMSQLNESARQIAASLREFNQATGHMRDAVDGLKVEIAPYRVEA